MDAKVQGKRERLRGPEKDGKITKRNTRDTENETEIERDSRKGS